jgi:hypothetical protein
VVLAGIRAQLIDGLLFSPLALSTQQHSTRAVRTPLVLLGDPLAAVVAPAAFVEW